MTPELARALIILGAILAWVALNIFLAPLVGGVVRYRDRQVPVVKRVQR